MRAAACARAGEGEREHPGRRMSSTKDAVPVRCRGSSTRRRSARPIQAPSAAISRPPRRPPPARGARARRSAPCGTRRCRGCRRTARPRRAAARPASANASAPGSAPSSTSSAVGHAQRDLVDAADRRSARRSGDRRRARPRRRRRRSRSRRGGARTPAARRGGRGRGKRTSTSSSPGSIAVVKKPRKKSAAGISRSPSGPATTTVASSRTASMHHSAEGSAWATEPPNVPRVRIGIVADPARGRGSSS